MVKTTMFVLLLKLDLETLKTPNIVGELYAVNEGEAKLDNNKLVMPPYSIVIMK